MYRWRGTSRGPAGTLRVAAWVVGGALGLAMSCKTSRQTPEPEVTQEPEAPPRVSAIRAPAPLPQRPSVSPPPSVVSAAPPPPVACVRPGLIADFEDDNPTVCREAGRGGRLVIYSDGTGAVSPGPGNVVATDILAPPRGTSRGALRVSGKDHRVYGVGVAVHLASGMLVDVSTYTGVQVWLRSAQPLGVHLKLATRQTMSAAYGGDCTPTPDHSCNDHHGVARRVGPTWQLVKVPIVELKQLEDGFRTPFDPTQVVEFHVRVPKPGGQQSLSFELWIDDISFY